MGVNPGLTWGKRFPRTRVKTVHAHVVFPLIRCAYKACLCNQISCRRETLVMSLVYAHLVCPYLFAPHNNHLFSIAPLFSPPLFTRSPEQVVNPFLFDQMGFPNVEIVYVRTPNTTQTPYCFHICLCPTTFCITSAWGPPHWLRS